MFLPLATETPEGEPAADWPRANTALIVITILISAGLLVSNASVTESLVLVRGEGKLAQLLSHAFLHADASHLIGNMIFLFAFGNALNMRLGNKAYLGLYLLTAGFAGLAWLILGNGTGAVGASGAAMGVIGAALVLLPFERVSVAVWVLGFVIVAAALTAPLLFLPACVLYWVYSVKTWEGEFSHLLGRLAGFRIFPIPLVAVALVLIALDAWAVGANDGVAHWAHIGGFVSGIVIAVIANATGFVQGTTQSPTALEWVEWLEPIPSALPRPAQYAPSLERIGVLGERRDSRPPAPAADFESWRRELPDRTRRRSVERDGSGRLARA